MWAKLKKRFSRNKPDHLKRFRVAPFTLTLEQWQKSEQLVSEMAKISEIPIWRAMMQMMRNECPSGIKLPQRGALVTDRVALQCHIEGYRMALNNLEAVSSIAIMDEPPEATFGPEQQQ